MTFRSDPDGDDLDPSCVPLMPDQRYLVWRHIGDGRWHLVASSDDAEMGRELYRVVVDAISRGGARLTDGEDVLAEMTVARHRIRHG